MDKEDTNMVDKEKESKQTEGTVELTEVPTQVAPAVKLPTGEVVSMEQYFVWLGQQIYEIKKSVA